MAWCPKSESETTRPARNAPMASERPGARGRERRAQHEQQDGEEEQLLAPRRRDRVEEARDQEPRREEHEDHRGGRLPDGQDGFQAGTPAGAASGPDEQHHRNDHQVAEDVDSDEEPPVRRVELAALD